MRPNAIESIRREKLRFILTGVLSCVGVISVTSVIFSLIIAALDLPPGAVTLMSGLSLSAGCFAAGFTVAKRKRRKGMLTGLTCGIIIFLGTAILGIVFVKVFSAMGLFSKLIMILACSALGGIAGVNSPVKRR